jgi:hypothetical protein
MNQQLATRIKIFNEDYLQATGRLVTNFVCPITLLDEPVELIKGHVVSQSLKNCSRVWVPQRKDVDGAFSSVESDLQGAIDVRGRTTDEIVTDKKLYQLANPKIEFQGKEVKHRIKAVKEQTNSETTESKSNSEVDLIAYLPKDEVKDANHIDVALVIERDDCAAAFVSALQAAHLTMFHLLGYYYVFSYSGNRLRTILNDYFAKAPNKKRERIALAKEMHRKLMRMSIPLVFPGDPIFSGTVADKKFLMIIDESGRDYAWGIIVRFKDDYFAVPLPVSDETAEQYDLMMTGSLEQLLVRPAHLDIENRRLKDVAVAAEISTLQFIENGSLPMDQP